MLEKKPFQLYRLDEEKPADDRTPVVLQMTAQDMADLAELQDLLSQPQRATAIKTAVRVARNVIRGTFGADEMRYISSRRRVRPEREGKK